MTKKQGYSSIVCFILVSIITIVLLLNGIIIHAEGNEEVQTGGTLSSMFDFDYSALSFSGWQNSGFNTGYASLNCLPNMSGSATNYSLSIDTSDFTLSPKQFIFVNRSGWSLGVGGYLVLVDNVNVVAVTGNNSFALATTDGSDFNVETILYNSDGTISTAESPLQDSSTDGVYVFTQSRRIDILTASMFIYGSKNNYNIFEAISNIVLTDDPLVNGLQMNYLLFDQNGDLEYENPFAIGGSGSSENASNNMFLQFPKWYFYNVPQLTSLGSYYLKGEEGSLGTATFNAELTDYQREHLSEFSLKIDIRTYVYIEETRETVEKHQRFYDYPTQTIPLTTFYSNSNNYNVSIRDIFQNSTFSSPINGNVTYLDDWLNSFDNNYSDELKKLQTKFTATLVSSSSSNTTDSGSCSYVYDYLTGRSFMDDNTLGTNPNPDFDSDQSYNGFGDDDQIVSNGGNTLINNDNDTITIESNGEVAERIVNNMLPEQSDAGLSEQFQDILNSNGWVAVVQNTFSFVPESVINTISLYLVTVLGILAAAFVLRIVLDLL